MGFRWVLSPFRQRQLTHAEQFLGMYPERDDRLQYAMKHGERMYGFGTSDIRPSTARKLIKGPLTQLHQAACARNACRAEPKSIVVILDDFTRGEVRMVDWDQFFSLSIFVDRSKAGKPLMVEEKYERSHTTLDFSAHGNWLKGKLKPDVHLIQIAIQGQFLSPDKPPA